LSFEKKLPPNDKEADEEAEKEKEMTPKAILFEASRT
jgi:hypothetical protein